MKDRDKSVSGPEPEDSGEELDREVQEVPIAARKLYYSFTGTPYSLVRSRSQSGRTDGQIAQRIAI